MAKRALAMLLALALCLALPSAAAAAEDKEFEIDSRGVLIKYNGEGGAVTIPDGVTGIGNSAFSGCTALIGVTISEGVADIGMQAFSGCTALTGVTIPDSVTDIGYEAFRGCTSLEDVAFGSGVTDIGLDAFRDTPWLERQGELVVVNHILLAYQGTGGAVTIPDGVTTIGRGAFRLCKGLTEVTIPDSVTTIESLAFWGCEGLTSMTIPDSVTTIGSAFEGCTHLTDVTIGSGVTNLGYSAFAGCWALTSVTIPDSVTAIEGSAFSGCSHLTDVTIPDSVTSIGKDAFKGTPWLERQGELVVVNHILLAYQGTGGAVVIPDGVTSIVHKAFEACEGLTSITMPDGLTEIGETTFYGCTNLTDAAIPASVTSIGWCAFHGCSGLKDVYYSGTEAQWKAIQIEENNDPLTIATKHYNSTGPAAIPTDNSLAVDGKAVEPAAYKIGGANYFMLRDVAMLLNGSPKQFAVDWDGSTESAVITSGQAYVPQGYELRGRPTANATANLSTDMIYFSGKKAELTIYKIGDNNYIKLRDLGILLDFYVGYDDATKSAFIDTNRPYDHNS